MTKSHNPHQLKVYQFFDHKPVSFCPGLVKVLGSVEAAIFFGQLLYWHGKGAKGDWVYKTIKECEYETGLSRYQQESAIKKCTALGFLETKLAGIPATRHFKVKLSYVISYLYSLGNTDKVPSEVTPEAMDVFSQSITETTQQITSEDNTIESEAKYNPVGKSKYEALKRGFSKSGAGASRGFEKLFNP